MCDCKTRLIIPAYNLTASPTYFKPHKLGDRDNLIDGGMFANNSFTIALVEAISKCEWSLGDISLLSIISVIKYPTKIYSGLKLINLTKLIDLFIEAECQENHFISNLLLKRDPLRYKCIEAAAPKKYCVLDNATSKSIDHLIHLGQEKTQQERQHVYNQFCTMPHNDYVPYYKLIP